MSIKLTDLLIENIFEATNTAQVLNMLIPNPATGKNIRVKSALSRTDHPAYESAKEFIKGKMGSEEEGTQANPTAQAAQDMADETESREQMANTQSDLMSQGFTEEESMTMLDTKEVGAGIDKELQDIASMDPKIFSQLSPEKQQEINTEYDNKIAEKRDNLVSQKDSYVEKGIEPPEDLMGEINAYEEAIQAREVSGMSDTEQEDYYEKEGESGLAKRYQQGLDLIDIDQELAGQADVFDADDTATGI